VLVCRGYEPEWSLRIEGPGATLATLGTQGLAQTGLAGRLQEIERARPPFLVLTSVRKAEPALARASEIALADGLTCRFAGKGAPLASRAGARASPAG
jgi:hypothetical protein